jgi:hypothetical protein
MSRKDYVDKEMKEFHYKKEKATFIPNHFDMMESGNCTNVDRLELIKKQISNLKKCL